MLVFPAVFKRFCGSSATFREAGITYFFVVHQQTSTGSMYGFGYGIVGSFSDSLVTLTMVICAYVENGMIFTVVPTDVFFLGLDEGKESFVFSSQCLPFFDLGKKPAA